MNDETEQPQEQDTQRPAQKFSGSGGLTVAVWKHKQDEGPDNYSVKLERNYKTDDGFKSTNYLRPSDLLRAGKLLDQADQWIEQDKGKGRGVTAGHSM